jgi:hypothetical protein
MELRSAPRLSIVLEWENVLKGGEPRAEAMLRQLAAQSPEICSGKDPCIELISMFDPGAIDGEDLREFIESNMGASPHVTRTYLPAAGEDYYAMKNIGARASRAPLVMFLDSDVIPEKNWLAPLLATCDSVPEAGVVASTVYLESGNLVSATLSLIWVFQLRPIQEHVVPLKEMRTNSTIFRRELALAHPFTKVPGTARSSCALLTEELLAASVKIVGNTASRLEHPSVHGIDFVKRAIARGRDAVVAGKRSWYVKFASEIRVKGERLIRLYSRAGIRWWQLPVALGIAVAWWAFNVGGAIATLIAPRFMRRHFLL